MRCVLTAAEYLFARPLPMFEPLEVQIQRILMGPEAALAQGPQVQQRLLFDDRPRQVRTVVWQDRVGVVYQSDSAAVAANRAAIISGFTRARPLTDGMQVARTGVRSHWILAFDGTWDELLVAFRTTLTGGAPLLATGSDLMLVMDQELGAERYTHIQIGPMKREQLVNQFLVWNDILEVAPEHLVFVDVDYSHRPGRARAANPGQLDRLITEGLQYALEFSTNVEQQFTGAIG